MASRSHITPPPRILLVGPDPAWLPAVAEAAGRIGAAVDTTPDVDSALAWMLPPCRLYSHVLATVKLTTQAIDALAGMLDEVTLTPTPLLLLGSPPSAHAGVRCVVRPDADALVLALRSMGHMPANLPKLGPAELAACLHGGGLRMRFQPILRSKDLKPIGLEALARIHHVSRGIIHPRDFIPLAIASGQERVLTSIAAARSFLEMRLGLPEHDPAMGNQPPDKHARQNKGLERDASGEALSNRSHPALGAGMYMTLNIPMVTLLHEKAALRGLDLCQMAGISPDRIVLEVLENSTAPDPAVMGKAMAAWRAAGFRLAIDDAGPSLPHWRMLVNLPFDILKLDGAIVADPAEHDQVERITSAAQRRGLFVVAEGIEDEACLARMRGLGVDAVQGFLFSRPLPSLAVPVWLRQWDPATLSAGAVRAA
jgi:EAL domain-containing protein (putative c-di-GMP-specific phosphodiesterase class I)